MTKRFKFSLQKLLEFRDRKENSQSQEFKNSHNDMVNEQNKLLDIQKQKLIAITESNDVDNGEGKLILRRIKSSSSYINQLSTEIEQQEIVVQSRERNMEKAQQDLIEASKEKMIIEQLRDRHITEYTKHKNKNERKQENETALRISMKGQES